MRTNVYEFINGKWEIIFDDVDRKKANDIVDNIMKNNSKRLTFIGIKKPSNTPINPPTKLKNKTNSDDNKGF